jgi:dihydropteroate synthase
MGVRRAICGPVDDDDRPISFRYNPAMFSFFQLPADRPRLMGIVNVTPDSFSDGGTFFNPAAAAVHARTLASQGAGILDFGAEASSFFRPGIAPIPADEQLRRLLPVLDLLRDLPPTVALSVDTRSAQVARAVLRAGDAADEGADLINDISAGTHDPEMFEVVAEHGAAIILMHMTPGYPATPAQDDPDILATVRDYLARRAAAALAAGIAEDRIALDPGIGFGKTMADNWRLVLRAPELSSRFPLVIGVSRKRFLDTAPPPNVALPPGWDALVAELKSIIEKQKSKIENSHPRDVASAALALLAPSAIHRLHNVALAAG